MGLRRLTLTDDLIAHIALVVRARELASTDRLPFSACERAHVDLADAIVAAYADQAAQPTRQLPARASAVAVVEVSLRPKRRRRA